MKNMKTRYRLTRRGIRGNKFYCVDTTTGKRTSLGTTDEEEARQIVEAKNNSERRACLVPPLYGSLPPSRLCALSPFASTFDRVRSAIGWHLGITLGVCMSACLLGNRVHNRLVICLV